MRSVALCVSPSFHSVFLFCSFWPPNFSLIDTHFWRGFFPPTRRRPPCALSNPGSQSQVKKESETKLFGQWQQRETRVLKEEPLSGLQQPNELLHNVALGKGPLGFNVRHYTFILVTFITLQGWFHSNKCIRFGLSWNLWPHQAPSDTSCSLTSFLTIQIWDC